MRPELKDVSCADIPDIAAWRSDDVEVVYWLQLTCGLPGKAAGDNYQVCVATPEGLNSALGQRVGPKGGSEPKPIVVRPYSWEAVHREIDARLDASSGDGWPDIQDKLRSLFVWEYEGMGPRQ